MSGGNAVSSFHVLSKPTGAICNLERKYCFFLPKEDLYPNSKFRMTDEMLERYVRQPLEGQAGPEATIGWQGGEPRLMGLDFFRRSVELAQQYRGRGRACSTRSRPTARFSTRSGVASCTSTSSWWG